MLASVSRAMISCRGRMTSRARRRRKSSALRTMSRPNAAAAGLPLGSATSSRSSSSECAMPPSPANSMPAWLSSHRAVRLSSQLNG